MTAMKKGTLTFCRSTGSGSMQLISLPRTLRLSFNYAL